MRTTIGSLVGRRGDARARESVDETLERARRLFADVAAFLEAEMDRLWDSEMQEPEPEADRLKAVRALILENQRAMRTVLEIETKLGLRAREAAADAIDLEDARAEIERRLARLAA